MFRNYSPHFVGDCRDRVYRCSNIISHEGNAEECSNTRFKAPRSINMDPQSFGLVEI